MISLKKILISRCFLGENVKYDGSNNKQDNPIIKKWLSEGRLIPICPECDGGLSTPRPPAEIVGERVINCLGCNVTAQYTAGGKIALDMAKKHKAEYALMKQSSPSCGSRLIYDGTFSGKKIPGMGIAARILHNNGIKIFDENEIELLADIIESNNKKMTVPPVIEYVLKTLNKAGYEAYNVGGCVRDFLMDIPPSDYDITTSATPEEIMECFKSHTVVPTGIKHGTVTLVAEGENIEITTFRTEGEYTDNRHPDSVNFTRNLSEDLSRRDFTMNAVSIDVNGKIHDPFGGAQAIKSRQIICVGVPDERFHEDGLRIMRGIRFASVLGFTIEKQCSKSIHANKHLLKNISAERIYSELSRLICGQAATEVLDEYRDVIFEIIPELNSTFYDDSIKALGRSQNHIYIRLAILLHNIANASEILHRLKCDGKTIKTVTALHNLIKSEIKPHRISVRKILSQTDFDTFKMLLRYIEAVQNKNLQNIQSIAETVIEEKDCISIADLAVNGNDIIKMGITGIQTGKTLKSILNMVMEDKLINHKTHITEYIKKHMGK